MRFRPLFLTCITATLFAACSQDNVQCHYHFMTSEDPQTERWELRIDGQSYGQLPNPVSNPDCDNPDEDFSSLIHVVLDSKKHIVEAIDSSGTVRSTFYIKQDDKQMSVGSTRHGNSGASSQGTCDCTLITAFD